jgi:hypothetical protein
MVANANSQKPDFKQIASFRLLEVGIEALRLPAVITAPRTAPSLKNQCGVARGARISHAPFPNSACGFKHIQYQLMKLQVRGR